MMASSFRICHAVARQRPAALFIRRGAAQDDEIADCLATGLEQKRYVENGHHRSGLPVFLKERITMGCDQRMDDRFQHLPPCGIGKNGGAKTLSVYRPVRGQHVGAECRQDGSTPPPGAIISCTAASASWTGIPRSRIIAAVVDFPTRCRP